MGAEASIVMAQPGAHHVSMGIARPAISPGSLTTTHIVAVLRSGMLPAAEQQIAFTISWPDERTWFTNRDEARKSVDEILDEAIALIDDGSEAPLEEARRKLERLVAKNPRLEQAYIELARVAMKAHWGPEGLHQAETLLKSALEIRPDSANAKILIGYVYTHQGRDAAAQAMFVDAAKTETKNLWLWANWGELLARQGKVDQAIQKYRVAVTHARTHDTYDGARLDAYRNLLRLLEQGHDLDGMEALHKQRTAEFSNASCFKIQYARFMLQQRGNSAAAIGLAQPVVEEGCDQTDVREVLGAAHYVAWASAANPTQRAASLNQARVFLPPGPRMFYVLAGSDVGTKAARQLIASGESIDQHDNEKLNALAYALQHEDLEAARRLLRWGAQPSAPIGWDDMPAAVLPVLMTNIEAIRLMQEFGVDYSKLRYQGQTAIDHARHIGDRKLLDVLDPKGQRL
jgi:Tfp pilus assembly protein PilF